MKNSRHSLTVGTIIVALAMLAGSTQAQQVPFPQTAAEVLGPMPGTAMTKAYVQMVGRMAYLWGWALVDNANRHADFSKAPEPGLIGGVCAAGQGSTNGTQGQGARPRSGHR